MPSLPPYIAGNVGHRSRTTITTTPVRDYEYERGSDQDVDDMELDSDSDSDGESFTTDSEATDTSPTEDMDESTVNDSQTTSMHSGEVGSMNFMRLPYDVRIRVYRYAHLVRYCAIDFVRESYRCKIGGLSCLIDSETEAKDGEWISTFYPQACKHPAVPWSLFRVSKAVYEDVFSAFWGLNHFHLNLRNQDDLQRFKIITMKSHPFIGFLNVALHNYDGRKLLSTARDARSTINLLRHFCRFGSRNLSALAHFSFECRTSDSAIALRLVSHLNPFRRLKDFAIRFNSSINPDIQSLARRTATKATRSKGPIPTIFPFMKLPPEIQIHILSYLLVVRWDPYVPNVEFAAGQLTFHPRKEHRRLLNCCRTCSPNHRKCYCSARQNAFSTTCSCFRSPLPYLLVSRGFHLLARDVFYSKNHFVLVSDDARAMLRFMDTLPSAAFPLLRNITFLFPLSYRYSTKGMEKYYTKMLIDWAIALRFLREHCVLQSLSVRFVDMGSGEGSRTAAIRMWTKYVHYILRHFTSLRGLRHFQTYLCGHREHEARAETALMGPGYQPPKAKNMPFIGSVTS